MFNLDGKNDKCETKDASISASCSSNRTQFTCVRKLEKTQQKDWKILKGIMDELIDPAWDIYFQYGFEVLGPLLFGFCKWLHEKSQEQKLEHLFFLSRDGYLLLNAYKEIYPEDKIPISYLYISRKAAREAQVWLNADLKEISKLFPENIYLECREFCSYFSIESEETIRIWEDCGLPKDMRFLPKELPQNERLAKFYERMKPQIIEKSRKAYLGITQYLRQNGFRGKVGIVDIGWGGTIQNCLNSILKNDLRSGCEIVGYYLGLSQKASGEKNKLSFIAAEEEPQEFDAGFVEYPFLAPEGSLIGYSIMPDGTVKPRLENYEYNKEGKETVRSMQTGTIHFIKCAKKFDRSSFSWDAAFSYANLKRMSKHPSMREVNIFGDLVYFDGEKRKIAAPKSIAYYLMHLKDFKYDLSVSGWRIAFLRRLFKANFNYNGMLKLYKNTLQAKV